MSSSGAAIFGSPLFASALNRSAGSWQPAHQRASVFGNRFLRSSMLARYMGFVIDAWRCALRCQSNAICLWQVAHDFTSRMSSAVNAGPPAPLVASEGKKWMRESSAPSASADSNTETCPGSDVSHSRNPAASAATDANPAAIVRGLAGLLPKRRWSA